MKYVNLRGTMILLAALLLNSSLPVRSNNAEDDNTIRPGIGIGIARLGMSRSRAKSELGNSDGSYALPSGIKVEYSEWKEPKVTSTIKMFYDSDDKLIQLICAAPVPATENGISLKSSFSDVTTKYKHLKHLKYASKTGPIDYYDDQKRGIAFAFSSTNGQPSKNPSAIIVHRPGKPLIADLNERPVASQRK